MRRPITATILALVASLAIASSVLAGDCVNPDKQPGAGAQVLLDVNTLETTILTEGLQRRIDLGLIDVETGEGFHGLVGLDFDSDGTADLTTWFVGPDGEIPQIAQDRGAECHGVINIGAYFFCVAA